MASPVYNPKQGNTFAIFVIGMGYDELKAVFDKLSEGIDKDNEKSRFQELHEVPFGIYGQLIHFSAVFRDVFEPFNSPFLH
jgi:PhnB protein